MMRISLKKGAQMLLWIKYQAIIKEKSEAAPMMPGVESNELEKR